jgi:acyl-CoA thioesterase-1
MQWLIYFLLSGVTFFWGAIVLALAVVVRASIARRFAKGIAGLLAMVATILVAVSAAALPIWVYGLWSTILIAWVVWPLTRHKNGQMPIDVSVLLITVLVSVVELSYELRPSPPPGQFSRLYVIGDSISAGIGVEHGNTWPKILRIEHSVDVVDLSRAGATIVQATRGINPADMSDGLVLIEIGGNDVIGQADPAQFGRDLDSLIERAGGARRQIVLLELPLLPFDNAYGVEQRRVARRHKITLVPKRFFIDVLSAPNATVDGIHLSAAGQRRMAEMVWSFIGTSMSDRG